VGNQTECRGEKKEKRGKKGKEGEKGARKKNRGKGETIKDEGKIYKKKTYLGLTICEKQGERGKLKKGEKATETGG